MRLFLLPLLFLAACSAGAVDSTARFAGWPNMYAMTNGEHILRSIATPDNSTAEDNTSAAGGTAVAYTFLGGERVCYECVTTDAWVEVIAAASMTASGNKGRLVKAANEGAGDLVCDTLLPGTTKVSFLCTAAGPCKCKIFEVR